MATSIDQFIDQISDSGLYDKETVRSLIDRLPVTDQPKDVQQLARLLVKQGKLTAFQAKQIYAGKGKSLVLGNYAVLDKLGQGGMGMVLKAEHRRMKRIVALKVLAPTVTKSPDVARRFQREVEAAAKLEHPNIVTAHDADEANGTHFLVMQYVEGKDLAEVIKDKGPLSVATATNYILQAARGLEYAHGRGIVHRDIKPANLLLNRTGTVKILDMGLARIESLGAEQDQLTGTGQIMGTVDFMAPEQAMNTKDADARADIYSLGMTLWYLLSGRVVYEGESLMAKLVAHRERPVPSLQQVCPQASTALESAFARMVAKTPEMRYQSMSEVIADLEQCERNADAVDVGNGPTAQFGSILELPRGQQSNGAQLSETTIIPQAAATSPNTASTVTMQASLLDTVSQKQQTPSTSKLIQPKVKLQSRFHLLKPIVKWLALGGGAFFMLLAGIVFFLPTKDGVIRVEIDDPQIEVSIKGTGIVLKQADQGKDISVTPGDRVLVIKRGDFSFETDKLILKKGTNVTVRVELLADQIKVYQGDSLLGQSKLSQGSEQPHPVVSSPPAGVSGGVTAAESKLTAAEPKPDVSTTYSNSFGMQFVRVPKGTAWLGGVGGIQGETKVVFEQDFYLGKYEVTQEEWEKVTGLTPSAFKRGHEAVKDIADADLKRFPVEFVSWEDCQLFLERLNKKEKESGWVYRLPTGAEWEYACRGGPVDKLNSGFDFYFAKPTNTLLPEQANFQRSGLSRTCKVGSYEPNVLGLYDMHGNVYEWCDDTIKDANGASGRMALGGGFWNHDFSCRAWERQFTLDFESGWKPSSRVKNLGLRLARVPAAPAGKASAAEPKPDVPGTFTNGLGMKFMPVPKGTAWLGGGGGKPGESKVEIKADFFLGKYEVTQEEWEKVTGLTPSGFKRGNGLVKDISDADLKRFPVEMVSWEDCQLFIKRLNETEKESGWVYRLPTGAEWEYACRGGPVDKLDGAFDFYFAKPMNTSLPEQANFQRSGLGRTCKVGSYEPNVLGLYDMHGNVCEWCDDTIKGANGALERIARSGGFWNHDWSSRAGDRYGYAPASRTAALGLRLARVPSPPPGDPKPAVSQ